ncbi:Major facilitator superfamily domain general substrate transporter [Penicillium robsamsonii]|uniref:Major facilitator superfamily domain general substrate transporter n=1 Tax=Penicillium robsamsonii TaxID=1792511 RepID=UPI002546F8FA|nr:Major facilitator superfamily domain general substrate transporter [Penicillium robsamsonii]KAJ5826598.1 Major facilitator superfamily domain general substrate transporter [Penicillium robsamsonii]
MSSTHDAEKGPHPVLPADNSLGDRPGVHDPDPDPNEVFWDDDADPSNPMNWSAMYRWCHVGFISLLTFVTSLASSMLAPAVHDVMKYLGSDDTKLESALSELYGRTIVYHFTNEIFLGVTIGRALSTNMGIFLAFRFISGCVGVAPLALGGGTIGDLMPPERIGTAIAVWGLGSLVALVFSPIAGGYLSQDAGWRWIFWFIVIPRTSNTERRNGVRYDSGVDGHSYNLVPFLIRETYGPVLLEAKIRRLRKETDNPQLKSRLDARVSHQEVIFTALILTTIALYAAVVYGYQYLVFTTLAYIFQDQYYLSTSSSSLVYLGTGVRTILGIFTIAFAADKVTERKQKRAPPGGKDLQPEEYLWQMIPSSLIAPIGLFWYG